MNYTEVMEEKANSLIGQLVVIDGVNCTVGCKVCKTSEGEKYVHLVPVGGISYTKDLKAFIEELEN